MISQDHDSRIQFLNHENPIERRAAQMMLELDLHNAQREAIENPIPEQADDIRDIIDAMRLMLEEGTERDAVERLEQQADILDIAFRRLLSDADTTYQNLGRVDCDPMKYAAAFKAQDQYRKTVKTLKALKKRGPYKKQRAKRNEIIE